MAFTKLQRNSFQMVADAPADLGLAGSFNQPMSQIREVDHRAPAVQTSSIDQLLRAPRSDEGQELINKYFSVVAEIDSFLEATRTARKADLSAQHDLAVEGARKASKNLEAAKNAEFAAQQKWVTLQGKAKQAVEKLQGASYRLSEMDRALVTRTELAAIEAYVGTLRKDAAAATQTEDRQFTAYREAVQAREAAEIAHDAAISAAESISNELDKL